MKLFTCAQDLHARTHTYNIDYELNLTFSGDQEIKRAHKKEEEVKKSNNKI